MARLEPLRDVCVPRDDVLAGRLADNHFAAQLDKIVRDPEHYAVYGDAETFFELTYPTTGLKSMLARTFGRLTRASGDLGENGVLRAETSFGGGKTHSLIAVYHVAKGARPSNLDEFVDPALLPDGPVQIAAVVGDVLDPVNGVETGGHRSFTLWGEVAAQLGDDAWQVLKDSDAARTAPGTETLRKVIAGRPTIVIIDEIAHHLRQLTASGDDAVRRSAGQVPVFLKNLFEIAAADSNLVVIVTLASAADAYGRETNELAQLLDETTGTAAQNLAEAHSNLARVGKVVKPATDTEIAEILKRRLFESVDQEAAKAAGEAYQELYEQLGRHQALTGGAEYPVKYGKQVERCYPFHPELIRVLDQRLGDIPNFQRARGALKLLAEVVAGIYEAGGDAGIINVAEIDFGRSEVLNRLTVAIDRGAFEGVAKADLAGSSSHAARVDASRFAGRTPYATRACRTVFVHSLELKAGVGAARPEYLLGTLRPGEEPELLDEALSEAEQVCWHLTYDGTRWRFLTEPNVNKIVEDEKQNVPNTTIRVEVEDLIRRTFTSEGNAEVVLFPESAGAIPDEPKLHLAVLHHDHVSLRAGETDKPPAPVADMRDHAGAVGTLRVHRNGVVFVAADAEQIEVLRSRVATSIAVERIHSDTTRMATYSDQVRDRIVKLRDRSGLEARVAVTRCYKHVYFPVKDQNSAHLRHREMPLDQQGNARSAVRLVLQLLHDEAKTRREAIPYAWLKARAWDRPERTTTKAVADWFWRDHNAPIVLDKTLISDAIKAGIRSDGWVYYDTRAERPWTSDGATPNVELSATCELLTRAEATLLGLLARQPNQSDVASLCNRTITGPELRAALEQRCGGEPTKSAVAELLADAVRNERLTVVDQEPTAGLKALGVKEIKERSLDTFTVLPRPEAERIGIEFGVVRKRAKLERDSGPPGVVLQRMLDRLADAGTGLRSLSLTVTADEARKLQDVDLIILGLGQLPRHDISVYGQFDAEFPGMTGGLNVEVNGGKRDFQSLSSKLVGLLKYASEVSGQLRWDVSFNEPVNPDDSALQQVVTVIRKLGPAELTVEGKLAQ
ncbi:ATP-binding protein [Streptomyces sp. cg2]|uniref:ATP-binding protein n=1 Tax=Streptomyces sp. cg2 TaxID=3238799 RepID=UPI0034E21FD4